MKSVMLNNRVATLRAEYMNELSRFDDLDRANEIAEFLYQVSNVVDPGRVEDAANAAYTRFIEEIER